MDQTNNTTRPARRTALVAHELRRYDIDFAALSETRFPGENSLEEVGEGYTFYWRGLEEDEPRIHGVGFAVKTKLLANIPEGPTAINERLMTWRIPLVKGRYITLISVYSPTLDSDEETKDRFYSSLDSVLQNINQTDKIALMGDFNARVGRNKDLWDGAIGNHGTGNMNSSGLRLLTLCAEHELVITNTIYQQSDKYKNTWKHPRSGHWHMLDYIITRKKDASDVVITRVMRGAECWTDHRMVRSKLKIQVRPPIRRQPPKRKLNCAALENSETRTLFRGKIGEKLTAEINDYEVNNNPDVEWDKLCSILKEAAEETVGFKKRSHADWFDQNSVYIHELLEKKRKAHDAYLTNTQSEVLAKQWKDLRAEAQQRLRRMENQWWIERAQEIQAFADTNNMQGFYNALKLVFGPRRNIVSQVRSADGTTVYKERSQILERWAEHFNSLLNHQNDVDESILDTLPDLPPVENMDMIPEFHEVCTAMSQLKKGKACGPDGIPGEVLKHGGYMLKVQLHKFICALWRGEKIPKLWVDPNIIPIFKNKGARDDCNNSRGIFLLSIAGKILARIMLSRLVTNIAEAVLPETQCGFRKYRSTLDMIFTLKQTQEKCIEQNRDLYIVFIDLKKAFDTVPRDLLWKVLAKYGVPPKFLNMLKLFHTNMQAKVCIGGLESPPFSVEVGVKQGDVLAPVLFNIFISTIMTIAQNYLNAEDGIQLEYRLDGSLFNTRRLQARTKTSIRQVTELQYADDAALISHTPESMQHILDIFSNIYRALGLQINATKTEVMFHSNNVNQEAPVFYINGLQLKNVTNFKYLGSVVIPSGRIDEDVIDNINKAARSFGRLRDRVFQNKQLKLDTKIKVYKAVCISTLLYGAETWTYYQCHIKQLQRFHISCLQKILGLTWKDRIPHTEIHERTNTYSIETLVVEKQLRWLGHVIRMPEDRIPRQVLYGQLQNCPRRPGGPKKRYKDQTKANLKKCNLNPGTLENTASDRTQWRNKTKSGVNTLEHNWRIHRHQKRLQRHARQDDDVVPDPALTCQACGKVCKSRIGLLSHTNAHQRRQQQHP